MIASNYPKKQERNYALLSSNKSLCGDSSRALEIDSINILNASIKAMQECVLKLTPTRIYQWMEIALYSKKGYKKTVVAESLLQQKSIF
jgi:ribonuclease HII